MTTLKNLNYSLIYKGLFIVLCALGVILNFLYLEQPIYRTLSYYTLQSNIACLALMIVLFVQELRNKTLSINMIRLKAGFTVMIFLTFLVYHFVLQPVLSGYEIGYQPFRFSDILVHYVSPLMMFLDFIIFTKHRQLKKYDPFVWLLIPLIYWIYTMIYAALGGIYFIGESVTSYPYFFLDFDIYGVAGVMLWVLGIMVIYIGLGYWFVGLDHLFGKHFNKSQNEH